MNKVCLTKAGFDNRKLAKAVARRLLSERGLRLIDYKCPDCRYFHLTSKVTMAYKLKARR